MSTQTEKIKELIELRAKARVGGGEKAIEKQHAKGKLTARERIALLLDEGRDSLSKERLIPDGLITGHLVMSKDSSVVDGDA